MAAVLDFGALQRVLADQTASAIPIDGEDSVLTRIAQILSASQSAGRLVQASDFMALVRPLHVIVTTMSTPDPWHAERRLSDTGSNLLSFDQFKLGARM